jgi:AraC-like DNA-binding protein
MREALRGRGSVRVVDTLDDVSTILQSSAEHVDVVVVPPRDIVLREAVGFVRSAIRLFPDTALVAYCSTAPEFSADIRMLAVAGVHHFYFAGERSCVALQSVLTTARRECAADRVMAMMASVLSDALVPIAEACLARPSDVCTVGDLVNALGLHRKTLYCRCRREGFTGPAELLAWSRLALVAYLLAHSGRTIESVADELEFASVTSLRNMMKRYTGQRASDVRAAGGVNCVVAALKRRLATRRALHLV